MTNVKRFDLEERTSQFGENLLMYVKRLPKNTLTFSLISQLIRSGTSIGANYFEANCAQSRKDFEHKISICKKESRETKYWLRMILKITEGFENETKRLLKEAVELNLIFSAIIRTSQANSKLKF